MDSKSKDHQSHIKYTQRQIFMRKPIKGENLFFFEMIGSLFQFCTSFTIEHVMSPLWDIITGQRFMMTKVARWMI
jgi:hypothetical protein